MSSSTVFTYSFLFAETIIADVGTRISIKRQGGAFPDNCSDSGISFYWSRIEEKACTGSSYPIFLTHECIVANTEPYIMVSSLLDHIIGNSCRGTDGVITMDETWPSAISGDYTLHVKTVADGGLYRLMYNCGENIPVLHVRDFHVKVKVRFILYIHIRLSCTYNCFI